MTDANFRQMYPFPPNYHSIGNNRLHYVDQGSGEPVVMVHGNPTWSFYYRRLASALTDKYRVIIPDHVGCGFSDKPQKYDYTLATHVNNLQLL